MCDKKHGNELKGDFKVLSLQEKKDLLGHNVVYIQGDCGCFRRIAINGRPKTWKRNPEKVQVPYKYGMYEYGYFTEIDEVRMAI